MTHSGGKPHEVGDRGQRFQVSVYDEDAGARQVVCWLEDETQANKIAESVVLRPGWTKAEILDRENPPEFGDDHLCPRCSAAEPYECADSKECYYNQGKTK